MSTNESATNTMRAPKLSVSERFMLEEFDEKYANICHLSVAILSIPKFANLKAVKDFSVADKIEYVRYMRFTTQLIAHKKAAQAGLVPLLDLDGDDACIIPPSIEASYADMIYSRTYKD